MSSSTVALDRFRSTKSGREKPGRFWKIDLEAIAPREPVVGGGVELAISNPNARAIVCDLATAKREHAALLERAFGKTSAATTKFGALAFAYAESGAFVYVPADAACDDPISIVHRIRDGANAFPYTVVFAERGARVTVVDRWEGGDGAFVCGATEIVTAGDAHVTYACAQLLHPNAQAISTRAALPGRNARVAWTCAELGSALSVADLSVSIDHPGIDSEIATIFFPNGNQHVDIVSTVDHRAGESQSVTIVKSASTDKGQGRYLGNIRIAAHAQGSDASLRDDALLLSKASHIDSVPALEIAANDVKAYHGATVGALDNEAIFYMESRGIDRRAAERMIAIGFFEPAIERFPTAALRDELRRAIEGKLA